MKKSEQLKAEAANEDSDSKALGLYTKAIREERIEKFEDQWLPKFQEKFRMVWKADRGCWQGWVVETLIFEFFPKKNNVFIKKLNAWRKPALTYLIKNYLNETRG